MKEVWKDVKGYEGIYEVSNFGNLKSFYAKVGCNGEYTRSIKGSLLRKRYCPNGYIQYVLCRDGNKKYVYAHRLVAQAFIENNKEELNQINHKDENKHNNHVDNLEWCTQYYNNTYGTKIERQVKSINYEEVGRKQSIPVNQYLKDGTFIKKWSSITQVKRELNISRGDISCCCRNIKLKTAGGFKWEYAN